MIGVIAAGGKGTRMLPITRWINKHMIPTGPGRLMIDYPLEYMMKAGFGDVTIVTGCEHAGQISEYVGDGHRFALNHVNYEIQPLAAGIADVVKRVTRLMKHDPGGGLCLVLGDNFFSEVQTMVGLEANNRAVCWQYDLGEENIEKAKAFGQVQFNTDVNPDCVVRIVEKPEAPQHSSVLTGLYFFPADVADKVSRLTPSERQELEITSLLQSYLEEGRLEVRQVQGHWADLGEWSSWNHFVSNRYPISWPASRPVSVPKNIYPANDSEEDA